MFIVEKVKNDGEVLHDYGLSTSTRKDMIGYAREVAPQYMVVRVLEQEGGMRALVAVFVQGCEMNLNNC